MALATAILLGVALVLTVLVTTPWHPLPGAAGPVVSPDPRRDFTAAEIARATTFVHAANVPNLLGLGVGLLVTVVLGFTPVGARVVSTVARRVPGWPLQVVVGTLALLGLVSVATAPIRAWRESVGRRYGLSVQSWGGWATDQLRGFAIQVVLVSVLLVVVVGLARWLPRVWWMVGAAIAAAVVVGLSFLYPLVIEPMFNHFTPLAAGSLRADVLTMARADGVDVSDVLVADASRRTTALNAYVSGFAGTRRVVIYDTLLQQPPEQVRLVVAHELGHAARGDVLHGTVLGALGAAVLVSGLAFCLTSNGLLRRAGADGPTDVRVLALVMALVATASTVAGPALSLVSRRIEARADVHSLDVTRDPALFTRAMRQLAVTNLSNPYPHPILYALYADHPSIPERLALARSWALLHDVAVPPDLARDGAP